MRMRVISLWQPFAWALFAADPQTGERLKVNETRPLPLPAHVCGERVAIHAAQRRPRPDEFGPEVEIFMQRALTSEWCHQLTYGAIIGTLLMVRSDPTEGWIAKPRSESDRIFGDWTPGRWAWLTDDAELLTLSIPARGSQGWWFADV